MLKKSLECSHKDSLDIFLLEEEKKLFFFFFLISRITFVAFTTQENFNLMCLNSFLLSSSEILSQDISS